MERCPDYLTIQTIVDGEATDQELLEHTKSCSPCRKELNRLKSLVSIADGLKTEENAPADFYRLLEEKLKPAPFPAALVAAAIFALTLLSLMLLGPSYLEWWLSVGITRQVGLILDAFLDLFAISRLVGPAWIIIGLAALVVMELFILKMLRNVEGWQNV